MDKKKKKIEPKKTQEDDKDKKIDSLTDTLQRLQADFENFRKRTEKEKVEFKEYAKVETIAKFLPIIDNLELALKHTGSADDFTQGIKLIFSQMISEIESMGVKKIESMGKIFNPRFHEALMADFSDDPKDTIIEEFQAGYILSDRIIRNSKVKISKGPKDDKEVDTTQRSIE